MHLRVARPVSNLQASSKMYCAGLNFIVVGSFTDEDGFSGVMLGETSANYHFEFTQSRTHPIQPAPTPEDLIVFYIPEKIVWEKQCTQMLAAGFKQVSSFNPYWDAHGKTFEDTDGYRVVLQNTGWSNG